MVSSLNVTPDGTAWVEKDKDARRLYRFDVGGLPDGDEIQSITPAVVPAALGGVTVHSLSWVDRTCDLVLEGGAELTWYAVRLRWQSAGGLADEMVVRVFVPEDAEDLLPDGTSLFPNRFSATAALRRDRLVAAAAVVPSAETFTDDYLWDKLRAAEAEVATMLRVPLVPTRFFPAEPTQQQIDELAGMPWGIDPGYDLGPDLYGGDRWGMVVLRNKPIISIERYRFAYPAIANTVYDIPLEWLRPDKKFGMVNIVPQSFSISVPLSAIVLQALSSGRVVPLMLQVTYTAGLENVARDWPQIIDVIKKLAVVKIIEDRFLPQSGSVSGDGLSQSMSVDMDKYRDTIEHAINGAKGSNGGIMAAIHGVRSLVF